ncbi:MAG TPA: hypothetical protein VG125_28035 [Pirellulales bacterium]|jgi:hypothetical protein|nr:hypothetical protein [Pirellulales bacterium]
MSNVGAAIAVGVGVLVAGLLTCCALKRKRVATNVVGLLGERDAPLMDALDQLLMRRELLPVSAHAQSLAVK